jgi:CubicO group peptidase (beta-lactamase class C family)
MMRRASSRCFALLGLAAILLAADTACAGGALAPGQPIPAPELERFVDGAVADAMAVDHIAGVAVAIVQPDGQVFLRGYGDAGRGRAVDPHDTLFRIGSISKTFTWITLMRQVEAGRVRLDAPVNDYLPPRLRIPDQGFRKPIRIIDLMAHAGGFEDRDYGRIPLAAGAEGVTPEAALERFRPNRVREPGVLASYSNYGAALAGYIAARAAGGDFETVVEDDILRPLGMTSTTFREPGKATPGRSAPMSGGLARRLATGFIWDGVDYRPEPFERLAEVAPAGSASATAADMAMYMRAQLAGGAPIYGPAAAQAFRTPILAVPEGTNGWAHGFMIRPLPGGWKSYGHGGSLDAFFSNMALIPALRTGVFVATNTSTGKPFAERLPALLVQRFYVENVVPRKAAGDPRLVAHASRFAGAYYTTRRAYSGLEAFSVLAKEGDRVSVSADGYLVTRVSSLSHSWVPDRAPGQFRDANGGSARLLFKLDDQGRAIRFAGARGTFSLERAGLLLDPVLFKVVSGLAIAAALMTLGGGAARRGHNIRPTRWQRCAAVAELIVAGLWLSAVSLLIGRGDGPGIVGVGPGPLLMAASWLALAAAAGSLVRLLLTPAAFRPATGGTGGWGRWRKLRHGAAIAVFLTFALQIAVRGGLTPWA